MTDKRIPFFNKIIFSLCLTLGIVVSMELILQIGVRLNLIPFYYPLDKAYGSYNVVPYFSKPCCRKDSISGFRWMDNGARAYKICKGEVIFDRIIKPNEQGFMSPSRFEPHKRDSTAFRWLIFGDSFTDGYYLSQNWPSALNTILRDQNRPIELHSFALNGSGIKTWARVLKWLDKMNYEYDGVIIACFGNDLSRNDFIMDHSGNYCSYGWVDLDKQKDNFDLPTERLIYDPDHDQRVKSVLEGHNADPAFHLLLPYYISILSGNIKRNLILNAQTRQLFKTYICPEKKETTDKAFMMNKYGKDKMDVIQNMLADIKQRNKKIVLASIPEMQGLKAYKSGADIQINAEMKWLAPECKAAFFDGYNISEGMDHEQLFLKYDGHWNQQGSDLFAHKIAALIIQQSTKGK